MRAILPVVFRPSGAPCFYVAWFPGLTPRALFCPPLSGLRARRILSPASGVRHLTAYCPLPTAYCFSQPTGRDQ